jgi:hypothetical protein
MYAEIEAMRENSRKVIGSVDYNKTVMEECDAMMGQLNPNIAKEKENDNRLKNLEEQMGGMQEVLKEMNNTLKNLKTAQS